MTTCAEWQQLHHDPALAAIRAGKHVVVGKPLEITVERASAIITAAEEAHVQLCPIFQARFGDGARTVKQAIDGGRLGRLVLCSAYVKWFRAAPYYSGWKGTQLIDGGGALMNQGIHAVDLLQWFAGMPNAVTGFTTRRVHLGIEVEDTAVAALKFESGALGTIEAIDSRLAGLVASTGDLRGDRIGVPGGRQDCEVGFLEAPRHRTRAFDRLESQTHLDPGAGNPRCH